MSSAAGRIGRTVELMLYALWPRGRSGAAGVAAEIPAAGGIVSLTPRQIRGGVERYLDSSGELHLLFEDCLPMAAPCLLFRLKREGYSCCRVKVLAGGLLVEGRR
jgi:hypothetical protein